jgi:hypothetical protein
MLSNRLCSTVLPLLSNDPHKNSKKKLSGSHETLPVAEDKIMSLTNDAGVAIDDV